MNNKTHNKIVTILIITGAITASIITPNNASATPPATVTVTAPASATSETSINKTKELTYPNNPQAFIYAAYDLPDGTYGKKIDENFVKTYNKYNSNKENPSLPYSVEKHETPSPEWVKTVGQKELDNARTISSWALDNNKINIALKSLVKSNDKISGEQANKLAQDAIDNLVALQKETDQISYIINKRNNVEQSAESPSLTTWLKNVNPTDGEKEMQNAPLGLGTHTKSGQEANIKATESKDIAERLAALNKKTNKSLSDVLALVVWKGDANNMNTIKTIMQGYKTDNVKIEVTLEADSKNIVTGTKTTLPENNKKQLKEYTTAVMNGLTAVNNYKGIM